MSKDKGYWVRIVDEDVASYLIEIGITCSPNVAVIKVAEVKEGKDWVCWVNSCAIKLNKSCLRPLSFVDALNLDMEHNAKWREICADCFNNELMSKRDALKKLFGEYNKEDKDKTYKPKEMTSIIDLFREQSELFDKFAEVICSTKFEPVKEEIDLPDEIDLYNFFEKYKGVAKGTMPDKSYAKLCGYFPRYTYHKSFEVGNLSEYLSIYEDADTVDYILGNNRYYAIKFKDRGVFLVSEKRYQELKAKKGL